MYIHQSGITKQGQASTMIEPNLSEGLKMIVCVEVDDLMIILNI